MKKNNFGRILLWILAAIGFMAIVFAALCFFYLRDDTDTEKSLSSAEVTTIADNEEMTEVKSALLEDGALREPKVQLKGDGSDQTTILVYMNGSNLESEAGEATTDLSEMVAAGDSDQVNIVVQTMGTRSWQDTYGIASDRSQIYTVGGDGLTLVRDDMGQEDCTSADTLSAFIQWGVSNYPADRYILLLWDHGGGPVYGFGYDEWNSDESACLSVDEMQSALQDAGTYFDLIGMDCCIMSSLEVCCALYDYCDYAVLSEDFESGLGWYYTDWLQVLYENPSVSGANLGATICDSVVSANEADAEEGDDTIMALIDESMMKVLYTAWTDFAYANESALLEENYSQELSRKAGGRYLPRLADWGSDWNNIWSDEEDVSLADYFVTDIMATAQNISSTESEALSAALAQTLVYVKACGDDTSLTGLSVTLPYGSQEFYESCRSVFTNIGLDSTYVDWLSAFAGVSSQTEDYDYSDWENDWNGWDSYDDNYDWSDWDYFGNGAFWGEWEDFSYEGPDDYGYGPDEDWGSGSYESGPASDDAYGYGYDDYDDWDPGDAGYNDMDYDDWGYDDFGDDRADEFGGSYGAPW